MFSFKKSINFEGVLAIFKANDYDTVIFCLDEIIAKGTGDGIGDIDTTLVNACKKAKNALSDFAYFDIDYGEVRVQFGYSDLATITNALLFNISKTNIEPTYSKITENPNTRIWKSSTYIFDIEKLLKETSSLVFPSRLRTQSVLDSLKKIGSENMLTTKDMILLIGSEVNISEMTIDCDRIAKRAKSKVR